MAKSSGSKGATRPKRRADLRRTAPKPAFDLGALLRHPEIVRAGIILIAFVVVIGAIVVWSRERLRISDNQIMTETRVTRVDYRWADDDETAKNREDARENAPKMYRLNEAYLDRIEGMLIGLPLAVAGKTELNDFMRQEYGLSSEGLELLQNYAVNGEVAPLWRRWVECLVGDRLVHFPVVDSEQFLQYTTTSRKVLIGTTGERIELDPAKQGAIELPGAADPEGEQRLREWLTVAVNDCAFPEQLAASVVYQLMVDPQPTLTFDPDTTDQEAERAALEVEQVFESRDAGELIYRRGDSVTPQQILDVQREHDAFRAQATLAQTWVPRVGTVGLCVILSIFLGLFAGLNYSRLLKNWLRLTMLCTIMGGLLLLTVSVTERGPNFIYVVAIGCTLFIAVVVRLAYDQRLALVVVAVQSGLVALALNQSVGWFILLLAGCAAFIGQLREIRNRNTMIRAASFTALILALGALILGVYETPVVPGAWRQIISNAGWSAAASFGVGFLVLGILPSIERLFDITTGMTLAELRDPKQPLLRQLQQRAPGTYNHSLQVANICEAAADAIGADGLQLYVGALYHDIGKMNKPDYFIENQTDGYNKHEKLSPAMSLLVIIGHVKDGIELAREYNLPRSLIHFIESHHGTTLVEYFYHAAKTAAEADDKSKPDEVVFRYPGPKPKTREAAILMLADAVESATRAMADPTPSRIESLVRDISRKRLTDGQFDQCPLTFRELGLIEDAIISRVCAIHHGRISYPSNKPETAAGAEPAKTA